VKMRRVSSHKRCPPENDFDPRRRVWWTTIVEPDAVALLERYTWPGNVPELRNVVERMAILTRGERITAEAIPPEASGTGLSRLPRHCRGGIPPGVVHQQQHGASAHQAAVLLPPGTHLRREASHAHTTATSAE
jgi:sigma-54 dependent transcriptional regulator, acetoin dehydrogenase operon transcriptional activator AcoR